MKKNIIILTIILAALSTQATIHVVRVWNGYFQFLDADITIQLGDTVQWLPLDQPTMTHTITSTNIPQGAASFNQIWKAPADTFFQYIPLVEGLYEYQCTPHASLGMVGSITVENSSINIVENSPQKGINIFPNPTSHFITFKNKGIAQSYQIYDISGQILDTGTYISTIDVSALRSGVYFIRIEAKETYIQKFIKE